MDLHRGAEYVLTVGAIAIGLAFNDAGAWLLDAAIGLNVYGLFRGIGALLVAAAGSAGVLTLAHLSTARSAGTSPASA